MNGTKVICWHSGYENFYRHWGLRVIILNIFMFPNLFLWCGNLFFFFFFKIHSWFNVLSIVFWFVEESARVQTAFTCTRDSQERCLRLIHHHWDFISAISSGARLSNSQCKLKLLMRPVHIKNIQLVEHDGAFIVKQPKETQCVCLCGLWWQQSLNK